MTVAAPKPRIDTCWNFVLKRKNVLGQMKYNNLAKVVKTCLACPHGNADSERSFSTNKNVVTSDRSCLHEDTLIAIRIVKDGIRIAGGSATGVPVTSEMLERVRVSHAKFKEWKAEQKKAEEHVKRLKLAEQLRLQQEEKSQEEHEERSKRVKASLDKLNSREVQLRQDEQTQHQELKTAEALLLEANTKLASALKSKNMEQIAVAQVMLEAGQKKVTGANATLNEIADKIKNVTDKVKMHKEEELRDLDKTTAQPPAKKSRMN
jgi:vacuolar-type H+-ATPase subunit I/STV1